jgi:hypothetical protein
MKTTSTKWAKLKHRLQREYWKKKHIDAPLPARAKRVLMSLSRCLIEKGPLHLNVEKRGMSYVCLDCGKVTLSARPKPKKSMRPRR